MPNKVPGVVAPLDPRRLVLRFPRDQMLEAWATSEVQQECPPFFPVVPDHDSCLQKQSRRAFLRLSKLNSLLSFRLSNASGEDSAKMIIFL